MSHEESVVKFNETNQKTHPDTPYVLDKNVQVLTASDLISDILEFLDSEE
ncbi:MAG: hypothetical protein ACTSRT_12090 [Promethearchaeota archaeon]